MGRGYATFVAGKLGFDNPGKYEFINRGIGGDRVVNLYTRMKCDIINLKPDVMSILIGVNDVWREFEQQDGVKPKDMKRFIICSSKMLGQLFLKLKL